MDRQALIDDVLDQWEDQWRQGASPNLTELCVAHPEILEDVRARVDAYCSLNDFIGTRPFTGEGYLESAESDNCEPNIANDPSIPAIPTRYRLISFQARGGLGEVFLAEDEHLRRTVAIKRIRRPHRRNPVQRRRFLREAEITGQLDHPGIVSIYSLGEDAEENPCYAMKYIVGRTLDEVVRRRSKSLNRDADSPAADVTPALLPAPSLRELISRMVAVCNTIAYAHEQGVIHRDIKPANIMLGAFGATYVVDWGLAKYLDGILPAVDVRSANIRVPNNPSANIPPANPALPVRHSVDSSSEAHPELTRAGASLGTPAYMSPEQAAGATAQIGTATDIYSLGATLYFILAGQPPLQAVDEADWYRRLQVGDIPSVRSIRPSVPPGLEAICRKAMAVTPSQRYAGALPLSEDLERWLADEPVIAWTEPWHIRIRRWCKRRLPWVVGGIAAASVALIAVTALLALSSRANRVLKKAEQAESTAKLDAQSQAAIATAQSQLALETLETVSRDVQAKLKNIRGAHGLRSEMLNTILKGLAQVAEHPGSTDRIDRNTMLAHRQAGELRLIVGGEGTHSGLDLALHHYQASLEIARTLVRRQPADPSAQKELATACDGLGSVLRDLGKPSEALRMFQEGFDLRQHLATKFPDDPEYQRQLSFSLIHLADLGSAWGSLPQQVAYYRRAMAIRKTLAETEPTEGSAQRSLMVAYTRLATTLGKLGQHVERAELQDRSREIAQRFAEREPLNDEAQRDLSLALFKLGDVYATLEDWDRAGKYFQGSYDVDLARNQLDTTNEQIVSDLSISLDRLAKMEVQAGHHDLALGHLNRVLELRRKLVADNPAKANYSVMAAIALNDAGSTLMTLGRLDEAQRHHLESLEIRQRLAAEAPDSLESQHGLAAAFQNLGDIALRRDAYEEALGWYEKALGLLRGLLQREPDAIRWRWERIDIAGQLAEIQQNAKHFEAALALWQETRIALDELPVEESQSRRALDQTAKAEAGIAACQPTAAK